MDALPTLDHVCRQKSILSSHPRVTKSQWNTSSYSNAYNIFKHYKEDIPFLEYLVHQFVEINQENSMTERRFR